MTSWENGQPGLLSVCRTINDEITYGPINPLTAKTYDFLSSFFSEIARVFQDDFIHLGFDEVATFCWLVLYDRRAFLFTSKYRNFP